LDEAAACSLVMQFCIITLALSGLPNDAQSNVHRPSNSRWL
jgi:hypothetical protein